MKDKEEDVKKKWVIGQEEEEEEDQEINEEIDGEGLEEEEDQ